MQYVLVITAGITCLAATLAVFYALFVTRLRAGPDGRIHVPQDHPNMLLFVLRALLCGRTAAFIDESKGLPVVPDVRVSMMVQPSSAHVSKFRASIAGSGSGSDRADGGGSAKGASSKHAAGVDKAGEALLPITYPQALAEVLGIAAVTAVPRWPLPLLPFPIHFKQSVALFGPPLRACDRMHIHAQPGNLRVADSGKGVQLDMCARVEDATGALRYESVLTGLYRSSARAKEPQSRDVSSTSDRAALGREWAGRAAGSRVWDVHARTGWQYAVASGDFSPIHLHPVLGRLLGFKGCVAHGMWSMAKALHDLEDASVLSFRDATGVVSPDAPSFRVDVEFKRPLLCPSKAVLAWSLPKQISGTTTMSIEFRVYSHDFMELHLVGTATGMHSFFPRA